MQFDAESIPKKTTPTTAPPTTGQLMNKEAKSSKPARKKLSNDQPPQPKVSSNGTAEELITGKKDVQEDVRRGEDRIKMAEEGKVGVVSSV